MNKYEQKFEEIYSRYHMTVFAFLHKLCRSEEQADTMTKETFEKAFKQIGRFPKTADMETWLLSIAEAVFMKYLKNAGDRQMEVELYVFDLSADVTEEADGRRSAAFPASKIYQMLAHMEPRERKALLLHIYGDVPFISIGRLLKISPSGAKLVFIRAKETAKEELFND